MSDIVELSTDRLVTSDELAEILGVKPSTIARWRRKRGLPAGKRVGKVFYFHTSRVRVWLCEAA